MGRSRSRVATGRAVLSYFGWAVCVLGLSWSSREIAVKKHLLASFRDRDRHRNLKSSSKFSGGGGRGGGGVGNHQMDFNCKAN